MDEQATQTKESLPLSGLRSGARRTRSVWENPMLVGLFLAAVVIGWMFFYFQKQNQEILTSTSRAIQQLAREYDQSIKLAQEAINKANVEAEISTALRACVDGKCWYWNDRSILIKGHQAVVRAQNMHPTEEQAVRLKAVSDELNRLDYLPLRRSSW